MNKHLAEEEAARSLPRPHARFAGRNPRIRRDTGSQGGSEGERGRKDEGDAAPRLRSRLIRTCRCGYVGWHGGRWRRHPQHRRRVQEVCAEHIQQEQVQQLLQAEGGAQRGGTGMQQGEFCLMDFFYLRPPAPILSLALFGLLLLCYRTLAFSLPHLFSPLRLHKYIYVSL